MTGPKPRNAGGHADEPSWCIGGHDRYHAHRSKPVVVGERRRGGQVTAWLEEPPEGPTVVGLNVAHLTGMSIQVPPTVVAALRDELTDLLDRAGHEQTDPSPDDRPR